MVLQDGRLVDLPLRDSGTLTDNLKFKFKRPEFVTLQRNTSANGPPNPMNLRGSIFAQALPTLVYRPIISSADSTNMHRGREIHIRMGAARDLDKFDNEFDYLSDLQKDSTNRNGKTKKPKEDTDSEPEDDWGSVKGDSEGSEPQLDEGDESGTDQSIELDDESDGDNQGCMGF